MNKLDKLKQHELIILDEIDRICKKYNIKYYLAYGTALGAIRHKGFIPWDDDIDLHMLSSDIEKFKNACKKELSKDYYYQDKLTDKYYYNFWPKIGLENTTWMPKDKVVNCKYGICVDIFPMFPVKDNKKDIKKIEKYIKLLRVTSSKYYVLNTKKINYSKIKKIIHKIIPHKVNNLLYKFALKKLNENQNNFDNLIIYDVNKDINIYFKKNEIIGKKELSFEKRNLPVVNDLDKYLKTFYGDYMTLPKEEDRYGHDTGDNIIYDFKNSYRKYLGDKLTKVSVIVPVYNVEKYLEKCLDSLVNQTLKDIEIIVVNDGSPDNSQKIIDKYAKKYKNIKAYIKKNGGLSDARNYGLKKATGDYIAFVDSDDYVSVDMYKKMYEKAYSGNFDMVVCDINYVYENSEEIKRAYSNLKTDTTDIKKTMLNIYPAAWNKIYKKKLFKTGIEFKKGVWFEDVEFIYRMLPHVKTIGVVNEPYNYYLQREGSITSSIDKRIYNYIDNWNGIVEYYKENNFYDKYYHELEYSYVRYLYATFVKQASKYNYEDFLKAVEVAIENVKKTFPKYRKNKYFYKSIKGIYLLLFNKKLATMVYKKNNKTE